MASDKYGAAPEAHATTHQPGGSDAMAVDAAAGTGSLRTLGSTASSAAAGNDARLSDARTPAAHAASHNAGGGDALAIDAAAGTGSLRTLGTAATAAAAGNDSRLSNARTPTSHASTHNAGGGDAMAIDAAAGTGSLRTLGTSATAACAGNDTRLTDEAEVLRNAQGILAETHSRITSTMASSAIVSGTAYFHGIVLRAGTVVTNITVSVSVAGVAVTLSKVGLFASDGTQLAVSADQGTSWHTTGNKTIAMGTPYTVLTTGFYYVAAIAVFTSTAPALIRGSTGAGSILAGTAIGSGVLPFGVQLAQADMPSPATIILGTNVALGIWGAIT